MKLLNYSYAVPAIVALLTMGAVIVNAEGDDHVHESCACAAKEEGFAINCGNQAAMTAAEAALSANDCLTDCSSEVCHRNFLIIQSHHDYCLEAELPPTLEDALHIYEDNCDHCEIASKFDPSLETCSEVTCSDEVGANAHTALTAAGCASNCSKEECSENYRILKVVHDSCPEDTLTTVSETNFHDMEEVCDEFWGCNLPGTNESTNAEALVCDELNDPTEAPSAGAKTSIALSAAATGAALMMALS